MRAILKERHIFNRNDTRYNALIAVTAGHLVAWLNLALHGNEDFDHLHHARRQFITTLQLFDLIEEALFKTLLRIVILLAHGFDGRHRLVVCNRSAAAVAELVGLGATQASTPADVARACTVVITMLPDTPDVERVLTGPGGVVDGLAPGSIVIDMSSISPVATRRLADQVAARGAIGSVNRKVAPPAALVSAHIRPPWASMIERLIDIAAAFLGHADSERALALCERANKIRPTERAFWMIGQLASSDRRHADAAAAFRAAVEIEPQARRITQSQARAPSRCTIRLLGICRRT